MRMMGYNDETGFFPIIETFDKRLVFTLTPGDTQTNSFQSNAENWVCVDRSATLSLNVGGFNPIAFPTPDNIKVSSWFESNIDGTKVTVTEDGPINLLFGSGEWQNSTMFAERSDSINNRIWSITNESEFNALIVLNFKFIRVARNISKEPPQVTDKSKDAVSQAA
jgi:hypothetical protein